MSKKCSIPKGDCGYLKYSSVRVAKITLLLFAMSAFVFLLGIYTKGVQNSGLTPSEALASNPFVILKQGDKMNLLTIVAVLGVLPAARYMVNLIMLLKAEKKACPADYPEKITSWTGLTDRELPLIYDLYLTTYEKDHAIFLMGATEDSLFGLAAEGTDCKAAEEYIRNVLIKDGCKKITIKLFPTEDGFRKRLCQTAELLQSLPEKEATSIKENANKLLRFVLEVSL